MKFHSCVLVQSRTYRSALPQSLVNYYGDAGVEGVA